MAAHAEELFAVLSEPHLYAHIDEAPPASVDALQERIQRAEARTSPDGLEHWLNWVVRDESGEMAGYVQATVTANATSLAYVFGSAFQDRGIATSAVRQMLSLVGQEFTVREFQVTIERMNLRSVRLAERLGFSEVRSSDAAVEPRDILMRRLHS